LVVITDACLCAYTSHGHCGLLDAAGNVLNDASLPLLARMATAHADAGVDVVAPSAMMDGQVAAIRETLDAAGWNETAIMSYAVKFASAFYGPFREAAASAPSLGDRRGYQLPIGNRREALREAQVDEAEGADWLMVKPALPYLDVLHELRRHTRLPLAAYQVSGEYAMLKHAAAAGCLDEQTATLEALTSIKRAGADAIITYAAREAAAWLGRCSTRSTHILPASSMSGPPMASHDQDGHAADDEPAIESPSRPCRQRAEAVLAGGVNSPVRCFRAVETPPVFAARGEGAHLWDVDGNRYIDLLMSWGALALGHAHPAVSDAVAAAAREGSSFGLSSPREAELAEVIRDAFQGIERMRFVNSGTEAVMTAVRLARAIAGRDKVLAFEGGYHGHSDGLLARAGSGLTTLNLPASAGVPAAFPEQTLLATYNDLASVRALAHRWSDDIACILVEPVAGNMGVVPPQPGFLEGLRAEADRIGALLIFDEVMTGFRVAWGGMQQRAGVAADLTTLGKIIGGGLPIGAVGGRAEHMARLAPQGDVYQAGTLSGNPLVMAAGLAALRELRRRDPYSDWTAATHALGEDLTAAARRLNVPLQFQSVGGMFTIFFSDSPINRYSDIRRCDAAAYGRFFRAALRKGVLLAPSAFEACFLGVGHLDGIVMRQVRDALISALRESGE
jgi:glutamate-1-semialdehyde 2,1-aminomutase